MKRIATQSSPFAARSELPAGSAKWKTTSVETTKSSIAGTTVAGAELEPQILRARA